MQNKRELSIIRISNFAICFGLAVIEEINKPHQIRLPFKLENYCILATDSNQNSICAAHMTDNQIINILVSTLSGGTFFVCFGFIS